MKSDETTTKVAQPGLVEPDEDASTRERVARSILEHGASTAAELGERLNLTPAAIRRHLGVLVEQGHIEGREQRVYGSRGRGRPAKVFTLTDSGRATFYQAYDELAIAALKQLVLAAGPTAVSALAEQRVADVEDAFHRIRAEQPEATASEVLTQALNTDGYVASVKPTQLPGGANAGEQLCQHHCPVAHVAEQFPQLCEAETQLFSRLLGSHVQRLATIAHGDGVCTTHIPTLAPTVGDSSEAPDRKATSHD
ncbi:Iron-sulfur cluster regulator SufR [Luteococcus japonicus LSP_Lj1]|uniref:Iron-sulfur cluster regulator SufR n=1 Tax=Luteococcus japonicus LSP_Lj1 TaxID=1255658 RepID=A0A1R4KM53_9ACTN|nr:Iron-sulfur cluster regulator SufR [Luteococcus japonicus LSP_Lj1]